jgi:peptidoglycan/xylan/chitin deacetylase (PgdA/CDA1 family)
MINLLIPPRFYEEKKYIADMFFSEFAGLDYRLKQAAVDNYEVHFESGRKIIFHDAFFGNIQSGQSYLQKQALPQTLKFLDTNPYTFEKPLPIIFGNNDFAERSNVIECGLDIFASAFFMLSRWEEYVIKKKDIHGRTPENLLFAVKTRISNRPLVDEYFMFFKKLLQSAGIENVKENSYQAVITHDIDFLYKYSGFLSFIKKAGGDLLKRRNFNQLFKTVEEYTALLSGKTADPYDTYDYLADVSEKYGLQSHFYFIAGESGEEDVKYSISSPETKTLIEDLEAKGHIIGIHGSYSSHKDEKQFEKELTRIKAITRKHVQEGRQHFLRFHNPVTWRIWNNSGLQTDSTLGFRNRIGFRAGTAREFPLFDILEQRQLALHERPLIIMDVALREQFPEPEKGIQEIIELKAIVKKYGGNLVLLWHNSNLGSALWKEYANYYERIIKILCN